MKLTAKDRLEIIEGLCLAGDEFRTIKEARRILDAIYITAHTNSACQHKDWNKEVLRIWEALKMGGVI